VPVDDRGLVGMEEDLPVLDGPSQDLPEELGLEPGEAGTGSLVAELALDLPVLVRGLGLVGGLDELALLRPSGCP